MFASSRYRCVPQIASPEARQNFSKKTYYSAIQDIVVYLKSPRRRRENILVRKRTTALYSGMVLREALAGVRSKPRITKLLLHSLASESFVSVIARHRCVPQIASPEALKSEYTTPPQVQIPKNQGAEPSAGRIYYAATGADTQESGR